MASWVLVPCLVQLRAELNLIAPYRDRTSDGTIGDTAHQKTVSDHNDDEVGRVPIKDSDGKHEVHAYDADADLRTENLTMEMVVRHILQRCRTGAEKRLRYIIFNRRIWEASNQWRERRYTGASPHTEHAHFSASYDTLREADTSSWRLEDIEVALTDADKEWLSKKIDAAATAAAERVWKQKLNIAVQPGAAPNLQEAGSILRYTSSEHHRIEDKVEAVGADVEKVLEGQGS